MEINSAKETFDMSVQNKHEKLRLSVMKDINDAVENGDTTCLCGELYPELQEELIQKGFDVIRFYETPGRETCNLVHWGSAASGKFTNFIEN